MQQCPHCDSTAVIKRGKALADKIVKHRYSCNNCHKHFSVAIEQISQETVPSQEHCTYIKTPEWISTLQKYERFVITSAQSNADVNKTFLTSLETYCKANDAKLIVIPIRYKNPNQPDEAEEFAYKFDSSIEKYLVENNIILHPKLKVLGALKVAATASEPLSGLIGLSKGSSIIIGHNQLQLEVAPVQANDSPVILSTTGTVSERHYSLSKQGYKAEYNHSFSAALVELDGDSFHLRHLNFDGTGFYDIDFYYATKKTKPKERISAIITGDEHVLFSCPDVRKATYDDADSIVNTLRPRYVVRHDVLDCYSISHHHRKDTFIQYKKFKDETNKIEDELNTTLDFIRDTTPKDSISIIISSNHHDHLKQWLSSCEPKTEPWNALLYHKLMYEMLNAIECGEETPVPFELYANAYFDKYKISNVSFIGRRESFRLHDIELSFHGDIGANGSRGSRGQFANIPSKTVLGHSHSPGILQGCYQAGTSSKLQLDYNAGPSSWLQSHVIIYPNGKRQLLNIIGGKWRK